MKYLYFPLLFVICFGLYWFFGQSLKCSPNLKQTQRAMDLFRNLSVKYASDFNKIPGEKLNIAWSNMSLAYGINSKHPEYKEAYLLETQKDAWGSNFFYLVCNKNTIIMRSFGPNKKDEKGAGDDISIKINLNIVKPK